MARWSRNGKEVHVAAFSSCRKSLPPDLPADTLETEWKLAMDRLGIDTSRRYLMDHEVRSFPAERQAILDQLIRLNDSIGPDLVLIPSRHDRHQDHEVIHREAQRAFSYCSLMGYELPWNQSNFSTDHFSVIDESDIHKKWNALQAYRSQAHRPYMQEPFIRALATVRGIQCRKPLAEAFEVYRLIG